MDPRPMKFICQALGHRGADPITGGPAGGSFVLAPDARWRNAEVRTDPVHV